MYPEQEKDAIKSFKSISMKLKLGLNFSIALILPTQRIWPTCIIQIK